MRAVERIVHLLATHRVAAEGVSPDEVLGILYAQFLRRVVQHAEIGVRESRPALHRVSNLPPLELHVLEVVAGLVAPFILHIDDGALAGLRHLFDAAGGTYHLRLFGVEVLGVAVVADDLLTLGHGIHQRVVAPIIHVHAEALQQLVGVPRERDVADDLERVAVFLVGDVGTRLLRPLHIVQTVLQLPCLQSGILEVRVALVLHRPRLLVQRISRVSPQQQVERMARRACVRDGCSVDGRHVVRNPIVLTGNQVPSVACILQLCPSLEDGLYLLLVACSRCQPVQCNNSHVRSLLWLILYYLVPFTAACGAVSQCPSIPLSVECGAVSQRPVSPTRLASPAIPHRILPHLTPPSAQTRLPTPATARLR